LRRTSRLVLLLGIFLAALTFVVVLLVFNGGGGGPGAGPTAAPTPGPVAVVVAAQDIPLGTVITADMVTTKTVAASAAERGSMGDPSQAIGQTAGVSFTAGQQITASGFLTRAENLTVPEGKRAFAISVNQLTGVGNLVETGDTVDLIISLRGDAFPVVQILTDGTISVVSGINPLSVKMPLLLQDVQVIGTIEAPPPTVTNAQGQQVPAPSSKPVFTGDLTQKLVILAVTPAQAEVLLFARTTGTLDVVLRNPLDEGQTADTTGVILKTLVDQYGVLPPQLVQVTIPTPTPK
jgi:pilus assembly protein CpaB